MKRQRKCDERRDALKMPTACKLQPTLLSHLAETRGMHRPFVESCPSSDLKVKFLREQQEA